MPFYETVYIARQDLAPNQVEQMTEQFCKIIKDNGGKIHKTEYWGLRQFAYRINKAKRGHYILIESDSPSPAVLEMERLMRLNEDVVRYLTIRQEALSKGPSVMMSKGDDSSERTEREAA